MDINFVMDKKHIEVTGLKKLNSKKIAPFQQKHPVRPKINNIDLLEPSDSKLSQACTSQDCRNNYTNILSRYLELQKKYRGALQQMQQRNAIYEMQKKELERVRKQHQRDQKQIYHLRLMLGFIEKDSIAVQTEEKLVLSIDKKLKKQSDIVNLKSSRRKQSVGNLGTKRQHTPRSYQNFSPSSILSKNKSDESIKTLPFTQTLIGRQEQTHSKLKKTHSKKSLIPAHNPELQRRREISDKFYRKNAKAGGELQHMPKKMQTSYSKFRFLASVDLQP